MLIRPVKRISLICTLLLLALFSMQATIAQEDQEKLEQLRKELEELNQKLQEYQGERDSIQSELRAQELKLSGIHRQIYDTDRNINTSQLRLTSLEKDATQLDTDRERQEEQLRQDLVAMYRTGGEEPLKMILNQDSPAEFSRMLNYYHYLLEARADRIETYLTTIQTIAKTREDILRQQNRLKTLKTDLASQETSLASAQTQRTELLNQIESRIFSAEQLIAQKEEDRAKLEELIADVEERIGSLAPPESYKAFAELKGQYSWPVDGDFSHRYNTSKSGSLRWQGVVIRSSAGTPISTIHYGRVVFADYLRGYGLMVIVDHGDGYLTLYGHNQSLFVEPGDWVAPGDQIALVGNSGGVPEEGLYFEIRHNGKPQNPATWTTR